MKNTKHVIAIFTITHQENDDTRVTYEPTEMNVRPDLLITRRINYRAELVKFIKAKVGSLKLIKVKYTKPIRIAPCPNEFDFMMLSRYESDCHFYLNYGERQLDRLYFGSVSEHIARMKELFDSFPSNPILKHCGKPEWITMKDINMYQSLMTEVKATKENSEIGKLVWGYNDDIYLGAAGEIVGYSVEEKAVQIKDLSTYFKNFIIFPFSLHDKVNFTGETYSISKIGIYKGFDIFLHKEGCKPLRVNLTTLISKQAFKIREKNE